MNKKVKTIDGLQNIKTICQINFPSIYFEKLKIKHGMSYSRFYRIWKNIKTRCGNQKNSAFKHYGYRGIKICNKRDKFEFFYEDMYESYLEHCNLFGEKNTTIERKNNDGNYSKINCRWAKFSEQALNRRTRVQDTRRNFLISSY